MVYQSHGGRAIILWISNSPSPPTEIVCCCRGRLSKSFLDVPSPRWSIIPVRTNWEILPDKWNKSAVVSGYISTYAIGNFSYLQVGLIHREAGTEPLILSSLGVN
ncbi:hypothetical protein OPV22_029176 [Ensete ventricosum]|uniref:Uncharacterized protein n=1 Tax=Ensete ventricosum TaxID=4639 RepID=A0AAV8Q5W8_ENSVE|nr:hypothetical protein OPV22_029176 [Ensete ventricosum]